MVREQILLMYSGGVDSVICLKKLVDVGITPMIFHIEERGGSTYERMARRIASILSPKSFYYTFYTSEFVAVSDEDMTQYSVKLGKEGYLYPLDYADCVVLGFCKWIYDFHKSRYRGKKLQQKFMEKCAKENLPYIFPLKNMTRKQVDEEFRKLPNEIIKNTISDTRNYKFGGIYLGPIYPYT